MLKNISRSAVDGYLKVVRSPVDAVLDRRGGQRSTALGVKIDRIDATARSVAGSALRDPKLKGDARDLREAADERERALGLRSVASDITDQAEAKVEKAEADAEKRRERAAAAEKRKKEQAEKRSEIAKKQASKTASARRASANAKANAVKAESAKQAKREKLDQLEVKQTALEKKEAALNAAAESKRLADAAAAAKAKRKSDA